MCLTLSDPMDCSPPGSSVHGILQVRILEQVAIPFSRGSSPSRIKPKTPALQADSLSPRPPWKPILHVTVLHVAIVVQLLGPGRLFATPWTAAPQASVSLTTSQSFPRLLSTESMMPPNHLVLWRLLILPSHGQLSITVVVWSVQLFTVSKWLLIVKLLSANGWNENQRKMPVWSLCIARLKKLHVLGWFFFFW